MNIASNFNNNLNTESIGNIINVETTSQESDLLIQNLDHENALIHSRNIEITEIDANTTIELTPYEFDVNGRFLGTTIVVTGDLKFTNNNIDDLHSNLIIQGTLEIEDCNSFTKIPSGLKVNSLSIINCNNLTSLNDIVIHKNLKIKKCHKLKKIEQNLTIEELLVRECDEIELSSNITVNKVLMVSDCPKITNLPLNYKDAKDIVLLNLNNLKLPDNFYTSGNLNICNCNIDLPENMTIKLNFFLDSCNSIECLPDSINVYRNIAISDCSNITALPSFWFTNLPHNLPFYNPNDYHSISISSTGISEQDLDNYSWELPDNIDITNDLTIFFLFNDLISIWLLDAGCTDTINLVNISTDEAEDIDRFLSKLTDTKEYKNNATKNYLANRVVNILKIIDTDDNLREKILFIIHDAISTCEDRTLLSLADIEFLPLLQQAEQQSITDKQGTLLQQLGKQLLYADEIQNYAITQAKLAGAEKEEIEFIISYKIQLASAFNLNFPITTMNYAGIPNLTGDDIKLARTLITMKVTDSYFEQWLNNWKPWQQHKRRWQLKQYNQLKSKRMASTELQAKDDCVISGQSVSKITDLVIYHNNIYSYTSLCKWYIFKGTNPLITNDAIDLNNIFAVIIDESNADESYKKIKLDDNI